MGSSAVRTLHLSSAPTTYPARRVTRPFVVGATKSMLCSIACICVASERRANSAFYLLLVTSSRITDIRKESPKKYPRSITCAIKTAIEITSLRTNGRSGRTLQTIMAMFIGMNSMCLPYIVKER